MNLPKDLLLQSQKNDVYKRITEFGFDPRDFSWEYTKSKHWQVNVSLLTHEPSGYWFSFDSQIDDGERQPVAIFSPGPQSQKHGTVCAHWAAELEVVSAWLAFLRREVESPDLWNAAAKLAPQLGNSFPAGAAAAGSEPFTPEEQRFLSSRLDALEAQVHIVVNNAFGATAQAAHEDAKSLFIYLKEQGHSQRRREWFLVACGALIQYAMEVGLPTEQASSFLRTVWAWLGDTWVDLTKLLLE